MSGPSANPRIPRALTLLSSEPNRAADAAIVEALPSLNVDAQSAAIALLTQRGHAPSLAAVVGLFTSAPSAFQKQILSHLPALSAGVRLAGASDRFEDRAAAVELIVQGEDAQNVFLLAEGLRSQCARTRESAGKGLHRLAETLLDRRRTTRSSGGDPTSRFLANELVDALERGLATWEIHKRLEVVQAVAWLIDRLEPAVRKKLSERRSSIARPLARVLERASDPRVAAFAVRSLALPGLETTGARAIADANDAAFVHAVLAHAHLLDDPLIRQGCRRIRSIRWLAFGVDVPATVNRQEVAAAVRFLVASGVRHDEKANQLHVWLLSHDNLLKESAVRQLINDRSVEATELLADVAKRNQGHPATIAAQEVRRRRPDEDAVPTPSTPSPARAAYSPVRYAFDRYWDALGHLTPEEESALTESLRPLAGRLLVSIRAKLASGVVSDRLASLAIATKLGLASQIPERIYGLCHDPDPHVRSLAVGMLRELPGPTARRILRAAVNDPEDRVQANAIEASERLGQEDRVSLTEPKLESTCNRVRANAIKSLLGVNSKAAGAALFEMLGDTMPTHRLSALWVVERLGLRAATGRVSELSERDGDPRVQQRAAGVLRRLAGGDASPSPWDRPTSSTTAIQHVGGSP